MGAAAAVVVVMAVVAVAVAEAVVVVVVAVAEVLIELIWGRCRESDVVASIARMIYPLAQTMGSNETAEKSDKSG